MSDDNLNETLIERLRQFATKPGGDNVEAIRSVAARLHSRAASQDRKVRQKTLECIWKKDSGTLSVLVTLLQVVRDNVTACSLAGILHESISAKLGKHTSPAIQELVKMNATSSLVKLIQQIHSKDIPSSEMLLQELLWVISRLAQKDSRFSFKVRILGAIKTFHHLLRNYSSKTLFPLLLVIKALAKNSTTTAVLAKDGVCCTVEKILVSLGISPTPKLRECLSVVNNLSKNKLCSIRMVKCGLISMLLYIFARWDRYEGKIKLRILSLTISSLLHLCKTKNGCKTMKLQNGLQLVYKFCMNCPDEKAYDSLLSRAYSVICTCSEKKLLPLDKVQSPAVFVLPEVIAPSPGVSESSFCFGSDSSSRETSPDTDSEPLEEDEDGRDDTGNVERTSNIDKGVFYNDRAAREVSDLKQYEVFVKEMVQPLSDDETDTDNCLDNVTSCESNKGTVDYISYKNIHGQTQQDKEYIIENLINVPDCKINNENLNDVNRNNYLSTNPGSARKFQSRIKHSESRIGLSVLSDIELRTEFNHAYCRIASRVNSVLPFVKTAYPDMLGGEGAGRMDFLNVKNRKVCREKILKCIERDMNPLPTTSKTVYDLDSLAADSNFKFKNGKMSSDLLLNDDENRLGHKNHSADHLLFESRFESGNLRKALQTGPTEYELILMPDVNSDRHHQWFYFEVSNMEAEVPYVFNIVNCEKQNSQFNFGMMPLVYSVREATLGRPGWVRMGTDICYHRNSYQNMNVKGKTHMTTTFTLVFLHAYDVCYIAYHFPYTYSQLLMQIWKWNIEIDPKLVYFRADSLCISLNQNETPLLTITSPESSTNPVAEREIVFLTGRVHPGESNSSWVMLGSLRFLLSNNVTANALRDKYVFKVVPMLNMEGVINGCHRCGLTDEDLNRRWSRPNPDLHPVIYHTKGLIEYLVRVVKKPPYVFCDYHGHSRRKNVFLYGCSFVDSWYEQDRIQEDNPVEYVTLPYLMQHFSPAFAIHLCTFSVERSRETTARVTVWREYGVRRSYTMESTFCGCDQGLYEGYHLDTVHLQEVGTNFCQALAHLQSESNSRMNLFTNNFDAYRFAYFKTMHRSPHQRIEVHHGSSDTESSVDSDIAEDEANLF